MDTKIDRVTLTKILPFFPEYVFLVSPNFEVLWANEKASALFKEETLCFKAVHGLEKPPPGCPVRKALEEGCEVQAVQKAERLEKNLYVSVTPIKDGERITALWHLGVDITSPESTQGDLFAQTYEIIGHLAAGLSHDIKNMLTAALGELEILSLLADNQPHLKRRYQKLSYILEQIASISKKLCSLGKIKSQAEILNLNQVLSELKNIMKALTPQKIQLHFLVNPYVKQIYFNRAMLEQIILNLFLNALHALPGKGSIIISTSQEGDFAVLSIEDNGIGIDADLVKHIFEPYFTTKDGGTGLGLALVKRWVEEAGGHIKVFTEEGRGSRFEIWLPTVEG